MITDAIPAFRLTADDIARDLARLEAAGVAIHTGEAVDRARLEQLSRDHDAVLVGIGAQDDRPLGIAGEGRDGVWPALRFLAAALSPTRPRLGREAVVIGGGNTAMDAARTAVRLVESGGTVRLVYRRTLAEMPAAREELAAIQDEGVVIDELLAPVRIDAADGRLALVCRPMRLGRPDASGRPRPEPTGEPDAVLACDTIVTAAGQLVAGDLLPDGARPASAEAVLADLPNVHVLGDALRGPATLVEAMGDGRRAADTILRRLGLPLAATPPAVPRDRDDATWQDRLARRVEPELPPHRTATGPGDFDLVIGEFDADQASREAARCLDCSVRCDVCVSVCPNRAMIAYTTATVRWPLSRVVPDGDGYRLEPDGEFVVDQDRQTANLIDWCNECGNCVTFCPTAGSPFADKPRLALSAAAEADTPGSCRLTRPGGAPTIRRGDLTLRRQGDGLRFSTPAGSVDLDPATFAVRGVSFTARPAPIALRPAAELAVLLSGLADHPALLWD
jgi:putative selenate reductase